MFSKVKYQYKDPFLKGNPQLMGETIDYITKNNKDKKSVAKLLVEEARSENSPIHSYFEWNDYIVAEKYRLHQAREYINGIETIVIEVKEDKSEKEMKPQRAFISIKCEEKEEKKQSRREYLTFENVLNDDKKREIHIKEVWLELRNFRNKYEYLEKYDRDLKNLFKRIDSKLFHFKSIDSYNILL